MDDLDHGEKKPYSLLADKETAGEGREPHPYTTAGWLSLVSYGWITSLLVLGAKQPLMAHDVADLSHEETCAGIHSRFLEHWMSTQPTTRVPRFNLALVRCFRRDLLVGLGSLLFLTCTQVLQPLVIQSILQYLQDQPISLGVTNGYALMALLAMATFLQGIALNFGFFVQSKMGVNMRSITMDMVYQKALKLSSSARQLTTSGEIVTLMSSDSERLSEAANDGLWMLMSPFTFVCSMVLVGNYFGAAPALAGSGTTVLVLLVSSQFASSIGRTRLQVTSVTEERVKVTSEVLQGIRVMKFYAWEPAITLRLETLRQQETTLLRRLNLFRVLNVEFLFLSPIFVGAAILSTYIALGNDINSTRVFTLIAFVNMSRQALYNFPRAIAGISEGLGAGRRLDEYLNLDEQQTTRPVLSAASEGAVCIQNATLSWKADSPPCLASINVTIAPGSLVMVVGSVGAGKSSLLSALLGEMHLVCGSVSVDGTLALVSQEPWIRNATVRDNILFEGAYDGDWYKAVLDAVQLHVDMKLLPAGDRTEIGEQGINLSGGQKARVNLARAMYKTTQSNVLLLDDPLSAVDVHVAKAIFDQAIRGLARHTTRIMVMNSHYQFLRQADRILVMEGGQIVGDGTFAELLPVFPQFLNRHDEEDDVEEEAQVPWGMAPPTLPAAVASASPAVEVDGVSRRKSDASIAAAADDDAMLIMDEDRTMGTVARKTYLDYFSHVGINGWFVAFSLVFMFGFGQAVRIGVDWWQGHWAASFATSPTPLYHGIFYILVVAATAFFVARCLVLVLYTSRCSENMHNQLLQCVLRAPVNLYFDVTPVGRILNRFARDVDILDSLLPNLFLDVLETSCVLVGALVVCATSSVYVAMSYVPVIVVFYVAGQFFTKSSRELKRLEGVSRSPIFSSFAETLDGIQTIRAFRMETRFTLQNREAVDSNAKYLFALVGAGRWLSLRMDTLSMGLIAVILCVLVAVKGTISPTVAGLTIIYSLALLSTVQWVIRLVDMIESAMTAVERLLHFKTIPSEALDVTHHDPSRTSWPLLGAVEFRNLHLRYRPDLPLVLRGISLNIHGGEKVGIVGRTGAGKSSLMIALFRISEFDTGSIYIDGDPVLFSGTLRDNLDPFGEKSDADLMAVAAQAHLDLSLSTIVAESGSNLSVGQRQLICIGRALLRRSRIIVMDEATANVDLATDTLIQSTIQRAFTTETVLTIAHRLDTILHCDRVVVLDKGQVVECDAPSALMNSRGSVFYGLAKEGGVLSRTQPRW